MHHTLGKIGRAETATDPAPLSMIETTIMLRPEVEYELIPVKRVFSGLAGMAQIPPDLDLARGQKGKDPA